MNFRAVKALGSLTTLAVCALGFSQAPSTRPMGVSLTYETHPVEAMHAMPTSPIVHTWRLQNVAGNIDLIVHPDGSYVFAGDMQDRKPGYLWDVTVALKNTRGNALLFHYEGEAGNGAHFAKMGQSPILRDNFATFASEHQATWTYTFQSDAPERRAQIEAMERRKEQLRREELEARERHNEQLVAQKRQEQANEAKAELAWEENYARTHQSAGRSAGRPAAPPAPQGNRGGGGPSAGQVVSNIATAPFRATGDIVGGVTSSIGDVVKSLGSAAKDILNIF